MARVKSYFIAAVILLSIWILLAGTSMQELLFGTGLVFIILVFFGSKFELLADLKLNPKALLYLVIYCLVFMRELIKSNIDVARRVVHPKLPINPGIVKVQTRLKSRLGRAFLANSITLTPGTLTVESKGGYFYIHWIDVSAQNSEEATQKIVSTFEKYLEVIYG